MVVVLKEHWRTREESSLEIVDILSYSDHYHCKDFTKILRTPIFESLPASLTVVKERLQGVNVGNCRSQSCHLNRGVLEGVGFICVIV